MKKTIIFDVDGTLLDTEKVYMKAWKLAGAKYGYTITDEALLKTRAVDSKVANAVFCSCCGEGFPLETVRQERVRISEELLANMLPEEIWKPYAFEVLKLLQSRGYRLAVASTTAYETTKAHLQHAGLWEFFCAVVCGDMVEHGKPAPDIFLKAAELSGAPKEDCLVVGDSPADVGAAWAAGIPIVLIPDQVPLNPETEQKSWKVLSDLSGLPALLK